LSLLKSTNHKFSEHHIVSVLILMSFVENSILTLRFYKDRKL